MEYVDHSTRCNAIFIHFGQCFASIIIVYPSSSSRCVDVNTDIHINTAPLCDTNTNTDTSTSTNTTTGTIINSRINTSSGGGSIYININTNISTSTNIACVGIDPSTNTTRLGRFGGSDTITALGKTSTENESRLTPTPAPTLAEAVLCRIHFIFDASTNTSINTNDSSERSATLRILSTHWQESVSKSTPRQS